MPKKYSTLGHGEWHEIEMPAIISDDYQFKYALVSKDYADPIFVLKAIECEENLRYERG